MSMIREGRVWAFGDRVGIETISPLKYMYEPADRGRRCLEQADPAFGANVRSGDLLIAGALFGHGPGHDHANLAIKEAGIVGVIAHSFGPQFFRHSIDHGLLIAECSDILQIAASGDIVRIDFSTGNLHNLSRGTSARARVPKGPAAEIVAAGGLMPFIRAQLADGFRSGSGPTKCIS